MTQVDHFTDEFIVTACFSLIQFTPHHPATPLVTHQWLVTHFRPL